MKRILLLTAMVAGLGQGINAQNLQAYTPSILFGPGDWEFKSFQNLYRQTKSFADGGGLEKVTTSQDALIFFTSFNQFLYGINDQINVGFDMQLNRTTLTTDAGRDSQTAISLIGPRIKIAPFKSIRRLSIQSSYLFKVGDDFENRAPDSDRPGFFFANDRSIWLTQFFYDKPLNSQFQLFFQQAFWYSVVDDSFRANNYLQTQSSIFVNYFPNTRWTFYAMTELFPTHYDTNQEQAAAFETFFVQSGLGSKFQLIPNKIELEVLYTNFWLGSAQEGAGETFNFGIRIVNQ